MSHNSTLATGLTISQTSPSDTQFIVPPQSVTLGMLNPGIIGTIPGYDAIVGPAITNFVQYTTLTAALAAFPGGARILILPGTYTEAVTLNNSSPYYIIGQGYSTRFVGNFTLGASSSHTVIQHIRVSGNISVVGQSLFLRGWCSGSVSDTSVAPLNNDLIVLPG